MVAIYSTFLNRAFRSDHDGCCVAPPTGHDGARSRRDHRQRRCQPQRDVGFVDAQHRARHRVAAPRDARRLREELGEALEIDDGPTAIRFPKDRRVKIFRLWNGSRRRCPRAAGRWARRRCSACRDRCVREGWLSELRRLRNQGIGVTVGRSALMIPVPDAVESLARRRQAGCDTPKTTGCVAVSVRLSRRRCARPTSTCRAVTSGVPQAFPQPCFAF